MSTESQPSMELIETLRAAGFRGELAAEQPLAPYTTWRIGGPAQLLARPEDLEDLRLALGWAHRHGVPWRVLGNGSNLLVGDAGVRGLVLRLRRTLDRVEWDPPEVEVQAGASFPAVARAAAARGLAGIEFGAGIPGTLGGAIVMNAGWHEFEIGNRVVHVDWLHPDGRLERLTAEDCAFVYRGSRFRGARGIVVATRLRLEPGEAGEIEARLEGFASSRKANQPTELPSCGSVFLQPPGDYAGRLIEQAGLKGRRVGGVEVSTKHANFFVNRGGVGAATAADVLELVEQVEREVARRFGVRLTREFELW